MPPKTAAVRLLLRFSGSGFINFLVELTCCKLYLSQSNLLLFPSAAKEILLSTPTGA